MIPLMDTHAYNMFSAKRLEMQRAGRNVSNVWVPVAGKSNGPPRVLFVGQAPRGFDEPENTNYNAMMVAADSIRVGPREFNSKYWDFIYEVMHLVCTPNKINDDEIHNYFGWSNLVKIGRPRNEPPPTRRDVCLQAKECVSALNHELCFYRPKCVVLMVSNYAADEIVKPTFFKDINRSEMACWHDARGEIVLSACHSEPSGPLIVWTLHPNRKSTQVFNVIRGVTAALIRLEDSGILRNSKRGEWVKLVPLPNEST